jgi:hypothetical protein
MNLCRLSPEPGPIVGVRANDLDCGVNQHNWYPPTTTHNIYHKIFELRTNETLEHVWFRCEHQIS